MWQRSVGPSVCLSVCLTACLAMTEQAAHYELSLLMLLKCQVFMLGGAEGRNRGASWENGGGRAGSRHDARICISLIHAAAVRLNAG